MYFNIYTTLILKILLFFKNNIIFFILVLPFATFPSQYYHTLNQQNREYYSLRFAEVQKELSGMKVELGSPR